jgi:hypothetical protein
MVSPVVFPSLGTVSAPNNADYIWIMQNTTATIGSTAPPVL